jgi:DNA modification methylase
LAENNKIIRVYPNPVLNELIIDSFAGSGTTLKVAQNLGFNYLGFEIDKQYIETIKNRLQ